MRPGMYGAYHHITVPAREGAAARRAPAHVVGTLCENNDWFARDRDLPADAQPGDLVYYADGGMGSAHIGVYIGGGKAVHGGWNGGTTVIDSVNVGSGPIYVRVR
jgi:cell wall-associated NlpC family hydrolase